MRQEKTMTEQPVEHEQQFLGNPVPPAAKLQAYLPNGHRIPLPKPSAIVAMDMAEADGEDELAYLAAGRTDLLLEAEVHAGHAVRSLENGGLDAGIAWLQSALAFALNARHGRDFTTAGGAI
jgi:ABC-type Fe3+ transport system substrate-binding protein